MNCMEIVKEQALCENTAKNENAFPLSLKDENVVRLPFATRLMRP